MSLDLLKLLLSRPLVVFDTETTGFYYDRGDEIIELAAEKLVGRDIVATFQAIIRPNRAVPPEVTAIHGLTDEYIQAHGESPHDVYPRFAGFMGNAVLVGHNIRRFDLPFLTYHFDREGLPAPTNDVIDTLELSRAMLKLPNHKLGTVAAHLGISTAGAHRAAADVAMTRQVLLRLIE